ncbi:MAG: YceD family protein [Candidatus Sedimenticola endophacoides]
MPEFVDPWRSADQKRVFSGRIALDQLPRLAGVLARAAGEATYELGFARDEKRRARIRGGVSATLTLECQRCLEAFDLLVDTTLDLAVVEGSAEAERLPEAIDPVLAEAGMLRLPDLIEDELLLSIPQVPKHALEACAARERGDTARGQPRQPAGETARRGQERHPFAVLSQLKKDTTS